jgi:2,5-diamino-6-(ribosylamino)-4(3H)-pyrimidinone 5'-phosphate reductase
MPHMDLHYRIAGEFKPDAHLIGSETVLSGIEMFGEGVPDELISDFEHPQRDPALPWWVVVDSDGKLRGVLHTCRRFEYCRDVILLLSESTPAEYIKHLKERNYLYIIAGREKVDLKIAVDLLAQKFNIAKILTDTGRVLGNLLLNIGPVNEISVLIHPLIVGKKYYPMFSEVNENLKLKLLKSERFDNGCVWNVYAIDN